VALANGVDFYDTMLNPVAPHHICNIPMVMLGETKSFSRPYTVLQQVAGI
jgi:hypothetical protein